MGYPQFREPLPTDQWNDASPSESSEVILRLACFSNPQLWPFLSYDWLFLWDYTFYKWGFLSTYHWYFGP